MAQPAFPAIGTTSPAASHRPRRWQEDKARGRQLLAGSISARLQPQLQPGYDRLGRRGLLRELCNHFFKARKINSTSRVERAFVAVVLRHRERWYDDRIVQLNKECSAR